MAVRAPGTNGGGARPFVGAEVEGAANATGGVALATTVDVVTSGAWGRGAGGSSVTVDTGVAAVTCLVDFDAIMNTPNTSAQMAMPAAAKCVHAIPRRTTLVSWTIE